MLVLAVHSTSPTLGVAIAEDGAILGEKAYPPAREHLERLAPAIGHLTRELSITPGSIDGFGVAIGPGSFSGIRVGMATVKGLALALGKPVVGVSSLEVLARQMLGHGAIGAAVVDARRGEMYAAVYKREGLHPRALHGPVLISKQELKPLVENLGARVTLCCSDALAEELEKLTPALVKGSATMSSAAACVTIAWERLHSGNTDDLHALVPLYIRRSDAEEKKSSRMQT